MPCILALDQGTTSSRALLFDASGAVRAVAQREFGQHFPRPGWVEHDPDEIWASQMEVAAQALQQAGLSPADVAAIGIANQRETTLVWDRRTGTPIHPAIVWQDRRTAARCDALREAGHAPLVQRTTGLVPDAYFSASKIAWLLDHVTGARALARAGHLAFGTVDSWLVWKMTGGRRHATDVTNASRTLLYDIHRRAWSDEMLALFDVPRSLLPQVCPSSHVYGSTDARLFGRAIPIAGIAGDQQAALFGQACTRPGMAKNTYGTGCFILMNTGERPVASTHNLVTTIAWEVDGRTHYALEGSIFAAGAVVQWLRDGLGLINTSGEVEALAARVPDNGGVYLVPAFTGLGAPYWDAYARGTLVGLTRGSTAAHIARAALESIAFQTADVIGAMEKDAGIPLAELRVDGGAAANNLLMQFQADVLGVPAVRPRVAEATARGAAFLAGLAVGVWQGERELAAQWQVERRFTPQMDAARRQALRATWRRALDRARGWAVEGAS